MKTNKTIKKITQEKIKQRGYIKKANIIVATEC